MIKKINMKRSFMKKSSINRVLGPGFGTAKTRRLVKKASIYGVPENRFTTSFLKMVAAPFYLAKENKERPLGEDAWFICDEGQTIGVADGVGGWSEIGIDAGAYARELMKNAFFSVQKQAMTRGSVDPKQVLHEAFLNTKAKGSSTACIISLKGDFLLAMNIGDSGFMVIREGIVVYQSPSQQKFFNCPYQLGIGCDTPDWAMELEVKVVHGDILVVGTDGVFDNLFPAEIEDIVDTCLKQEKSLAEIARTIAEVAREQSLDKDCISPFAKSARELGLDCLGGKYDDVTVIAAYIE
ncbi:hypothetical protein ACH5RR_007185 [Cinchona calisaya]|uniref:Protein phosphatase n=1 Tax=Cinchona calisaya TaxID=153742 RepID=A0ABD3AR82_9GENT